MPNLVRIYQNGKWLPTFQLLFLSIGHSCFPIRHPRASFRLQTYQLQQIMVVSRLFRSFTLFHQKSSSFQGPITMCHTFLFPLNAVPGPQSHSFVHTKVHIVHSSASVSPSRKDLISTPQDVPCFSIGRFLDCNTVRCFLDFRVALEPYIRDPVN